MSPRSPSPARPRSAARSPRAPRRRSSASRWSSAASRRTSSSPTPTSRPPPRRRPGRCSATPARTAARARGSSSRSRRSTASSSCSRPGQGDARRRPAGRGTQMGPLISAGQRESVASFLDDGVAGGLPRQRARRARASGSRRRCWRRLTPTRARRARRSSGRSPRVIPFSDEEEAVALANDTIYGLSGSIWTRDGARRCGWRARSRPASCRSTRTTRYASRRRSAASSSPATAASSGPTRSTPTPRSSRSSTRRAS